MNAGKPRSSPRASPALVCLPPPLKSVFRKARPILGTTLLVLGIGSACRQSAPPGAADPGMAACVANDAAAVAAADLDQFRASSFLNSMGGSARDLLERYRNASALMVAWNGSGLLIVLRGSFSAPPAGARAVEPGLALDGTPDLMGQAIAQHRSGRTGAPDLIGYGSQIGPRSVIWLAVRGGRALPLAGNAANLNRLLEDADFAGAALDLGPSATLRFHARARTAESAETLEQRLRAVLSLAAEAEIHRPELARLLDAAQVRRNGREVAATLSASPDLLAKLVTGFAR